MVYTNAGNDLKSSGLICLYHPHLLQGRLLLALSASETILPSFSVSSDSSSSVWLIIFNFVVCLAECVRKMCVYVEFDIM